MLTLTEYAKRKKIEQMLAESGAWHSKESNVYHNNLECPEGVEILEKNLLPGTGDKKYCSRCGK